MSAVTFMSCPWDLNYILCWSIHAIASWMIYRKGSFQLYLVEFDQYVWHCYRRKLTGAESKISLKQKIKKACKSAPAWVFGAHGPCIFRFGSRLEIESDRDKIRIRLFPKSPDYKYVSYVIHKEERHHVSQTTTLGASPPLILGFIQLSVMLPWSLLAIRAV